MSAPRPSTGAPKVPSIEKGLGRLLLLGLALVTLACSAGGAPVNPAGVDGSEGGGGTAGSTCSTPIPSDLGVTTLDDVSGALCVGSSGVSEEACGGSIIVTQFPHIDNVVYWLFDGKTKMLQAVYSPDGGFGFGPPSTCVYGIQGFKLPSACLDETLQSSVTYPCATGSIDADAHTDAARDASTETQ